MLSTVTKVKVHHTAIRRFYTEQSGKTLYGGAFGQRFE